MSNIGTDSLANPAFITRWRAFTPRGHEGWCLCLEQSIQIELSNKPQEIKLRKLCIGLVVWFRLEAMQGYRVLFKLSHTIPVFFPHFSGHLLAPISCKNWLCNAYNVPWACIVLCRHSLTSWTKVRHSATSQLNINRGQNAAQSRIPAIDAEVPKCRSFT